MFRGVVIATVLDIGARTGGTAVSASAPPPRKIALFVYSLHGGGAQRVVAHLAGGLSEAGDEVLLVTEQGPETDQYRIPPAVRRAQIGIPGDGSRIGKWLRMTRKVLRLRAILKRERPDMLVTFMTRGNNMGLLASRGLGIPVVICERNDPRHNPDLPIDRRLRPHLYHRADLLIAQTPTIEQVMREQFGTARTETIPNPCVLDAGTPLVPADPPGERPYILAVGRLTAQKGFDVLIRAYAASQARETLDLVIAGFGGERPKLEQLAEDLGVADRVHLPGYVNQPYPLMLGCRMFVLSSLFEGFPNVLLEAMSLGRPAVSTRLPSGAHAMIEDGESGLLVPPGDAAALAAAIDRLAADPAAAEVMGVAARRAVTRFELPSVIGRWRDVLATVSRSAA